MKRLALAAAIALGLLTFGAAPATAGDDHARSPVSAGIVEPASPDVVGEHGADSGLGQNEASEVRAAGPREDAGPADDADPTEQAGSTDAAESEEATETAEAAEPIDATFSLLTPELTPEEIRDPDRGIRYTIDGLKAGDTVTHSIGAGGPTTVPQDGLFEGTIVGDSEVEPGTTLDFTVTVDRNDADPVTFDGSVEVIGDESSDTSPALTVSPETLQLREFRSTGVSVTMTGCEPRTEVQFSAVFVDDPGTTTWEQTVSADEDGDAEATYRVDPDIDDGFGFIGDHLVDASCGETSAEASLTVTANDDDANDDDANDDTANDPTLTVSPESQQLTAFRQDGVTMTVTGCGPGEEVLFSLALQDDPSTPYWEETRAADDDGHATATFVLAEAADDGYEFIGEHLVSATCADGTAEATFTITPSGSGTIDPALTVDPTTIAGTDFVNENRGVQLTVRSCGSGRDSVRFEVWGTEPSALLFDRTVKVDEAGTASVRVFGLENRPEAYAGRYNVRATCGDTVLEGTFDVTSSSADDPDQTGDPGRAGSIPHTGAEITGLGAGLVLILLGAGAVIFARRNAQAGR